MNEIDLVRALTEDLRGTALDFRRYSDYYDGEQALNFLHPDLPGATASRLPRVPVNFARKYVDSIAERLAPAGFRLGPNVEADASLWEIWQTSDMPVWSQLGIVESLKQGRAFNLVWAGEDGGPRISVESAAQVTVRYKPGTRTVAAGLKTWAEDDRRVTVLYLPDRISTYYTKCTDSTLPPVICPTQTLPDLPDFVWVQPDMPADKTILNPLGRVPIVPMPNRPSLLNLLGESEMRTILGLVDAINKLTSDMMVSAEFHAMIRRWISGMEVPRDGTAQKKLSEDVRKMWIEAYPGKPWIGGKEVKFGQFQEARLDNFIAAIKLLMAQIAGLTGLPPDYLGLATDTPPSADAIRARESSLIKLVEDKQPILSGCYEETMRLAIHVRDGRPPTDMDTLETIWKDAATPTPAQKADAALKLTSGDRPIITIAQAREDLGYSPGQITRMAAEEQEALDRAATGDVRARLALADELKADGMTSTGALAAVGLLVAAQHESAAAAPPVAPTAAPAA